MKYKIDYIKLFFLIAFIVFSALTINEFYSYYQSNQLYDDVKEDYYEAQEATDYGTSMDLKASDLLIMKDHSNGSIEPPLDKGIFSEYDDVIGWISIEGTAIDYPVLQSTDNDYYLEHNFKGEQDKKGSIYMDYRNGNMSEDQNYLIYGHKMSDGSMFSDLANYVQGNNYREFFQTHDIITYHDFRTESRWKIFSVYVVDLDREDYYLFPNYLFDHEYQTFIDDIQRRSVHKTDIEVTTDDQLMSLVTCNYWFDNARVIVHAVRIDE